MTLLRVMHLDRLILTVRNPDHVPRKDDLVRNGVHTFRVDRVVWDYDVGRAVVTIRVS